MSLSYDFLQTPLGWIGLLASPEGLRRTTLPQSSPVECVAIIGEEFERATPLPGQFASLKENLTLYFQGQPSTLDDEPTDLGDAPPFLRAAWAACRSIPMGETRSYKWLAAQAGRPKAPRAAGQAMARNRLPIIVPCHRVVASDGTLGGFGRDSVQLDLKRRLLELEGASLAE